MPGELWCSKGLFGLVLVAGGYKGGTSFVSHVMSRGSCTEFCYIDIDYESSYVHVII